MLLRSNRYKHEKNCQGHLGNRKIKPQAKPKPKPKLVTIQPAPIQPKAIANTNEPTYVLEAQQKSNIQEQPIKSPQEIIFDSYKLIHQEYINKRKEKYDNLCANMFSGTLRSKRKLYKVIYMFSRKYNKKYKGTNTLMMSKGLKLAHQPNSIVRLQCKIHDI